MTYVSTVLADSPNAFWLLNEASGNFADQTANALTLTANGSLTYGTATTFPGASKGVTFVTNNANFATHADNALLDFTGNCTLEAVWKWTGSVGTQACAFSKGDSGTTNGYAMHVNASGQLQATANHSGTALVAGATVLSTSTFYYLVVTNTSGTWRAFVNASLDGTNTPGVSVGDTTDGFYLGYDRVAGAGLIPFTGTVAAVAVYPTALTGSQITNHYTALQQSAGGGLLHSNAPAWVIARFLAREDKTPPALRPRFIEGLRKTH